jgi:hypothetical protein
VPGRTGARLESDGIYAQMRRRRSNRDFVEPDRACEPIRAPRLACLFGVVDNLHGATVISPLNVRFGGLDLAAAVAV